jgi:cell division septation protein DedD
MNENDGERELVLGNRQLLTIFFVATLLCGVFFAMGYVVGGNSARSGAAANAANAADSASPPSSEGKREEPRPESAGENAGASPTGAPLSATGDTASTLPAAEPKVTDNPAAAGAQPPASVPATAAPVQAAPYAAVAKPPVPVPAPPASATTATGVYVSVPEAGAFYLQVSATARPSADDLVKFIRERKLPAILANGSKADQYRVLVGPYRSQLTLGDAKSKLKSLGYDGVFTQKF